MQIINTYPGELIVKVIPKDSFANHHSSQIINSLSQVEGMPFKCNVELVKELKTTKRGKHKFFIREF